MRSCTSPVALDATDCTPSYMELLQWLHGAIAHLRAGRKVVVLGGISFGGVLFENYIMWRARMGDPRAVSGLVLISNPTSEVWCSHLGGYRGEWCAARGSLSPPAERTNQPRPPWPNHPLLDSERMRV
eukprot:981387-Prymnesium_polylepis.1